MACPVHHIMPDGCIAADHEVACDGCRAFLCDHDCRWYDEIDPDVPADERPKPLNWSSGEQSPGTFQADGTDRTARNHHPTVKPVALMQWLVRLVTPPEGIVLDPFTGSGTTGIAALREGFSFIGIEREPEYVSIAQARIRADQPLMNTASEEAA